jgi:hypothetical protein
MTYTENRTPQELMTRITLAVDTNHSEKVTFEAVQDALGTKDRKEAEAWILQLAKELNATFHKTKSDDWILER